jgi:LytS/YehU family sensor histidine kinase
VRDHPSASDDATPFARLLIEPNEPTAVPAPSAAKRSAVSANVLDLLVETLPHLRGGLGQESAEFTARLLYANLGLDACAVVDREHVLAYVGRGEDHHLVGGPALTGLTHRALTRGEPTTARTHEEIACPVVGCPLTSVTIAPFIVRGQVVGALKLYRAGTRIAEDDERVAVGLARVFSVSLEVAELDARSALVTQAELDALRARVSPHFLFNTLTTIAALTRTDPNRAHDLVVDFAEYFRDSLARHAEFVTLDEELEHVEQYLTFEHARFGERLRVGFDIDPRARVALVPVLSVQPLVENAIGHGLAPNGGAGTVRVTAHLEADGIEIVISDDGVGFIPGKVKPQGLGIGMDNVNQRLTKLFGPESALRVTSAPGLGTTVAFRVPARIPAAAR